MRFRRWTVAPLLIGALVVAWLLSGQAPRTVPKPGQEARPKVTNRTRPAPSKPIGTETKPDYAPLRDQLAAYTAKTGVTYGIYFKDLKSGATIGINEDQVIHAASTIKVPIVLYLNTLVSQGKASFDTRVNYSSDRHYQTGAGVLQAAASEGDAYSLRVLSNLAITISDNVATNMLIDYLGLDNIKAFMRSLGASTVFPNDERMTTARDMGIYVQAVLDFAKLHPELGKRLLDDMAHSIYHVGLPGELPSDLTVSHKEGDVTGVSDDVGVVYSKRPFIFAVLSQNQPDPIAGFSDIARLTRIAYDYQSRLGE